jgi:hypothetical protein
MDAVPKGPGSRSSGCYSLLAMQTLPPQCIPVGQVSPSAQLKWHLSELQSIAGLPPGGAAGQSATPLGQAGEQPQVASHTEPGTGHRRASSFSCSSQAPYGVG